MTARCTPGAEFQCAVARSPVCHCDCGGQNHGKWQQLRDLRTNQQMSHQEAMRVLNDLNMRAAALARGE